MKQPIRPHGGVRGANLSRSSLLFGRPFGRIFRSVPAADFGPDDPTSKANLDALAKAMTSDPDPNDPKDGPDSEESAIPAAFTYFGQFIDHDLTFDPASSLQKQKDPTRCRTSARRSSIWTTFTAAARPTSRICTTMTLGPSCSERR